MKNRKRNAMKNFSCCIEMTKPIYIKYTYCFYSSSISLYTLNERNKEKFLKSAIVLVFVVVVDIKKFGAFNKFYFAQLESLFITT